MKAFFKSPSLLGRVGESPLLFLFLFFQSLVLSAQVTFPVDKNLSLPPEREIEKEVNGKFETIGKTRSIWKKESPWCVNHLKSIYQNTRNDLKCYSYSFKGDSLALVDKDVMFKFFVKAFAEHHPIVISPDMVWMMIGQGFSHYVNENSEAMRELLVSHQGKMTLSVMKATDDWEPVLNAFFEDILKTSKNDVAHLVTANFSTTGRVERMASQMLLMDVMKAYYEYEVITLVCGIPSVTLEGTPEDWQKVLNKTRQLEKYGLGWWVNDLTPILQEFVNASKGKVNTRFWQDMVMKLHQNQLTTARRSCGPGTQRGTTTKVDGWFLKFFPFNQDGRTPSIVPHNYDKMLPEMVRVPFLYRILGGEKNMEYPMEFWAGFVGVEEDTTTYALRPKIGWMVMEAEPSDEETLKLARMDWPQIKDVDEIPDVARRIGAVDQLNITFKDSIHVPDWIDDVKAESLILEGKYNESTLARLRQLLPDREIDTTIPKQIDISFPLSVLNKRAEEGYYRESRGLRVM